MRYKNALRLLAALVAMGALAVWLARGAHRGWTMNSVPEKTVDEVTGIEGITYRNHFVPGLDFLGGALLGASLLAVTSLFFRKSKPTSKHS